VSHFKRTVIEIMLVLTLIAAFGLNMYCRGKRVGQAGQEGKDRRENVEKARRGGDFEAIDKEWER
jgi:hypothetical protein